MSTRPYASSDTVNAIVALLVRFPAISSIRVHPSDGSVTLSFALLNRPSAKAQREAAEAIEDHVRALLELDGETPARLVVTCEVDRSASFLHVVRDTASFSREELVLLTGVLESRFGETLLKNPPPEDLADEDPHLRDELADDAIDAMRDPARRKSLVGFREEKRVLVYVLKAGKNAKARAR